ncbi:tetratricopeptide repeat-containing sensor histidine kinase [Fulvivirga sedimenti]|uniref:histidine kinase n=1 Tax=Fulvivirga sedimenti TaxID=2879465 RepID=A0A9X1HWR9_9BACT|nr:sensor histidine kinase [Fulvivirga sedimenti]MCA6078805.1 sensor histidine kinase [Fulvivirga sedimenti]
MKRKLYLLFLLTCLLSSVRGQNSPQDSLSELFNKAAGFRNAGEIDSALYYFDAAGRGHRALGNFAEAYQAFFAAYSIRDSIPNGDRALSLLYLGSVEGLLENFQKSAEYFSEAEKAAWLQGDSVRVCQALANLGSTLTDLEKYDSALSVLNRAEELGRIKGMYASWTASLMNNIGNAYMGTEEYEQALQYFHRAYSLWQDSGENDHVALVLNNIGYAHYNLEQLDSTSYYYYKSAAIARERDEKRNLYFVLDNLAGLYLKLGNMDSVVKYQDEYQELYSQIYEKESQETISNLRIQYETEKMERENMLQKVQIQEARNRQRLLLIALLVLLVAGLVTYILYKRREIRREKEFRKINDILKDQEIRSFHSVLDAQEKERKRIAEELHDKLGSTLSAAKLYFNNIEELAVNHESKVINKGMELLDIAVQDVRMISHNMLSGVLSQFGLVAALNDLTETITGSGKIKMKVLTHGVNQRLDQKSELHVYRIIQELVSNALKHSNATEVIVQVTQHDNEMTVTVEDNGSGFETARAPEGMGLRNVMNRVGLLNANINIDTGRGKGTLITIDIPTS